MQAAAGNINVEAGTAGSPGIVATGASDVLLQTTSPVGNVNVNATIQSTSGNISLVSLNEVNLAATASLNTSGTAYIEALDANIVGALNATGGSRIEILGAYSIDSAIVSAGDIVIRAAGTITQNADITSTAGDVLIQNTANDFVMSTGTQIQANNGIALVSSARDLNAATINAANISLNAGRDVTTVYCRQLKLLRTQLAMSWL